MPPQLENTPPRDTCAENNEGQLQVVRVGITDPVSHAGEVRFLQYGTQWDPALKALSDDGAVVLEGSVSTGSLLSCKAAASAVTDELIRQAEADPNGFDSCRLNTRGLGIVRVAKIGDGKRNIHFDPFGSSACHTEMARLGEEAGFAQLIRRYCGDSVSLNEAGLSLTRPGGGGLEWHADGLEGECTVIMALDDVGAEKGRLSLVLGSHTMVDRHACEEFDDEIAKVVAREPKSYYAYRAGAPIVFDARMLHAAEESKSDGYRVILWWIYNGGTAEV